MILNRRNNLSASRMFLITCFISLICFIAMARTAYLGGEIRHPEANSNYQIAPSQTPVNDK